jgi:hypothetical protein
LKHGGDIGGEGKWRKAQNWSRGLQAVLGEGAAEERTEVLGDFCCSPVGGSGA